ncbi:sensor histidine kinase [Luxibacter massiliensis]|uniref:sensor histidine kinase n=1 Tax=Luxibacter massiliensis TaxID=2219695 RepID=UPI000F04FD6C|nr:sensor histidine kinase [Luxibacter massiliensis]
MENKKMIFFKGSMLLINMLIISFILLLIINVTDRICIYNEARTFLESVERVPLNPGNTAGLAIFLMVLLIFTFALREWAFPDKSRFIYGTLAADFVVCIGIMYVLNFNYNGIVLWFFANVLYYVNDRGKYFLLALALFVYGSTDFQFLSMKYELFSVKSYMQYFDARSSQYYLGVFNLLLSVNIIFFIAFCVKVIQNQKGIIEEVNLLYKKLTDTNEELHSANNELKQYADLKEKMGQTKERNRLAREIHDTLGHTLTGISAGLDACITTIDIDPAVTKQQLNVLSNAARTGISEVRRSVNELRPDALERFSLNSAIEKMLEEFRLITKAKIEFQCEITRLRFDEDEENIIFRIIQESVTNSIRHGEADEIYIVMKQEMGNVDLSIRDNGKGCINPKKGFGLKHMQERVSMLNGKISFSGEEGFNVEAVIPIRWGEEYD